MNEHESVPAQPAASPSHPDPVDSAPWQAFAGDRWKKLRWFTARAVALLGSFMLLMVLATGVAAWYTSRPQFCRSCHIMEPYYVSWTESTHKDVSCIKCHFAPGAGEKIRGKLEGLAQLAKYVTGGRGPRPGAAEIPDASCLRSGCHETRLLSGRIMFQGIPFDHRPHLEEPKRGKQLRCTSCHSQIVQGSHMTVTTTTCFLCHFKEQPFNAGLGACTRCHQVPEKEYDLGGIPFTHDQAYERGVDCASCHADLIRGRGEVPVERCGVCHNRESDLKKMDDHVFLHEKHVSEHKVDCLNCHLRIQHQRDPDRVAHAAADCGSCHPNHHQQQVRMMEGLGAKTVSAARLTCASCHRIQQTTPSGAVVVKGAVANCTECHDAAVNSRLEAYQAALRASLLRLDDGLSKVRQALESAQLPAERRAAIRAAVDKLQQELQLLSVLRVGNDIHNIHYARALMRALVEQLTALCRELNVAPPEVPLPEPIPAIHRSRGQPGEPAAKPEAEQPGEKPAAPPGAETEKPADAESPEPSEKPADAEKPAETEPAPDAEQPMEAEQPTEAQKPPEPEKPADTVPPTETEKPAASTVSLSFVVPPVGGLGRSHAPRTA